jgi:hypothetical protein
VAGGAKSYWRKPTEIEIGRQCGGERQSYRKKLRQRQETKTDRDRDENSSKGRG